MGLLLVSGCQSPGTTAQAAKVVEKALPLPVISVEPGTSTERVRPDFPVNVTVAEGKLSSVVLADGKQREVEGSISADGTSWTATGGLRLNASYSLRATAVNTEGVSATASSDFRTVKPKARLTTSISPLTGSTVGVGMPIVVRLSEPAAERAEVERNLTVTSSKPVEGSWSWVSDEELHYRPRDYWPANTKVTLNVRLQDVDAGKGVWGDEERTIRFRTGASMVSVVDVRKLRLTVYRNGRVARTIPVSTGKAGFLTRNGIKVISEKHVLKIMDASTIGISKSDPEYYRLEVPYALRVTNSGEFVHAAPWSVASQGRTRVSHGCVGMSTANAIWLYNQANVGDIVQVVGSPRHLEPGNGWTDWNVSWSDWLEGSAL